MGDSEDSADTGEPARKLDRYGWFEVQKRVSKGEASLARTESEKENARAHKWLDILANFTTTKAKAPNTIARLVKKGIPDTVRAYAWSKITEMERFLQEYPPIAELLTLEPHPCYEVIEQDLARTFPQISVFTKPTKLVELQDLLRAYAQTDPELGYVQGMSFIAGIFLAYMDQDSAYYCFQGVMRLHQREFFLPGFPRLQLTSKLLECLMQAKAPGVLAQMQENGIAFPMFTPAWFLTAFQTMDWSSDFQLRIFDMYVFYGLRSLLYIGILIIKEHEEELLDAPIEVMLPLLQHPDRSPKLLNWRSALNKWEKLWITKAEFAKMFVQIGERSPFQNETEDE
jgi:hypothetical protein